MEYTRAKWTCYGGHVAKAKGEHNSNFFWWSSAVWVIQVSLYLEVFLAQNLIRNGTGKGWDHESSDTQWPCRGRGWIQILVTQLSRFT